ncbi:MAG: dihydroorotase [Desulfobulbaceae bacterium]|nr:dihydroorotase [Desulfobulbaceae bacterium]
MDFSPLHEASSHSLLLANGRIIDPLNGIDQIGDVLIENGSIVEVGPGIKVDQSQVTRLDLQGKWVVPGLIDMHVHLREPGDEYKETVVSGTKAAAAGGFTAVAAMPNTKPVNDNQSVTALIYSKAAQGYARVYPVGAISQGSSGENLAEFGEMQAAGVVAVSDDGLPVRDGQLMRRALEYAGNYNLLVISHSEEMSLSRHGVMNEGSLSTRMGLIGIPRAAEEIMVYRDIALARYTGRPVHIAHVSTRESVSLIRRAKKQGGLVTAETAPHYFTLTEEAIGSYDARAKMNPPLRTADDIVAIKEGLRDGTLDAIATDHAPHSELEKDVEFDLAANGIIGLETAVPLALALVRDELLTPTRLVELFSVNPARILGVVGGSLAQGQVADVTVIDPERNFTYDLGQVVSKSRNSPFIGWELTGKAVLTMVGGRVTYSDI